MSISIYLVYMYMCIYIYCTIYTPYAAAPPIFFLHEEFGVMR